MAEESLSRGRTLGGFRLEEKIYAGGMATIWKVSRPGYVSPMAMKIPHLARGDDPAVIVTFEAEQMILPRLTGPHVPRFIASEDSTTPPYLVMEFIDGVSLEDQVESMLLPAGASGAYDAANIALVGARTAAALHDIHLQHVIHLDLTPDNILFRKNGEAVLIDFGLSRHEQLPDLMAEVFSQPMGTAPYISPEQVLGIRSDPRSDIFSLGAILYQLTTGELPFGDPKGMAGLKRRLYVEPVPPRSLNRQCPQWLQEIILRCLEVDPADRYESAAQLAFALQHPAQVALTERAERGRRSRLFAMLKRWLLITILLPEPRIRTSVERHLASVPIVMVALDVTPGGEVLADLLREAVKRIIGQGGNVRLSCVTVRKTPVVGIDFGVDEKGTNLHMQYLVKLKHWARPLELPPGRISFHVLEGPDPAVSLVQYARANNVEHIVIGARGSSTLRRFLGSVSSQVVATARCTVTVVRAPGGEETPRSEDAGYSSHG